MGVLAYVLATAIFFATIQATIASERLPIAKPGDVITMTATNPDGSLCPVFSCGQGAIISRISTDTKLHVLQVWIEKGPMFDVPWYEVEYGGKKGWVSENETDRKPPGIGNDFCPRNPRGIFAGCDKR